MDLIKYLDVGVYKDAARPAVSEVGAVTGRTVKALLDQYVVSFGVGKR